MVDIWYCFDSILNGRWPKHTLAVLGKCTHRDMCVSVLSELNCPHVRQVLLTNTLPALYTALYAQAGFYLFNYLHFDIGQMIACYTFSSEKLHFKVTKNDIYSLHTLIVDIWTWQPNKCTPTFQCSLNCSAPKIHRLHCQVNNPDHDNTLSPKFPFPRCWLPGIMCVSFFFFLTVYRADAMWTTRLSTACTEWNGQLADHEREILLNVTKKSVLN